MASGRFPAGNTAVSLDIGGLAGNDVQGSIRRLRIQVPLVVGVFPSLNLLIIL
jgi:hypothetical protein